MDAGRLDQRITLQEKSIARNAIGGEVVTWSDIATVWAAALAPRIAERFAAEQRQEEYEIKFRIRHRAGLTREHRVLWNGRPFEIVGTPEPVPPGRPVWLDIKAVSGVRDGR